MLLVILLCLMGFNLISVLYYIGSRVEVTFGTFIYTLVFYGLVIAVIANNQGT